MTNPFFYFTATWFLIPLVGDGGQQLGQSEDRQKSFGMGEGRGRGEVDQEAEGNVEMWTAADKEWFGGREKWWKERIALRQPRHGQTGRTKQRAARLGMHGRKASCQVGGLDFGALFVYWVCIAMKKNYPLCIRSEAEALVTFFIPDGSLLTKRRFPAMVVVWDSANPGEREGMAELRSARTSAESPLKSADQETER